jgi:hypothetical protein
MSNYYEVHVGDVCALYNMTVRHWHIHVHPTEHLHQGMTIYIMNDKYLNCLSICQMFISAILLNKDTPTIRGVISGVEPMSHWRVYEFLLLGVRPKPSPLISFQIFFIMSKPRNRVLILFHVVIDLMKRYVKHLLYTSSNIDWELSERRCMLELLIHWNR